MKLERGWGAEKRLEKLEKEGDCPKMFMLQEEGEEGRGITLAACLCAAWLKGVRREHIPSVTQGVELGCLSPASFTSSQGPSYCAQSAVTSARGLVP